MAGVTTSRTRADRRGRSASRAASSRLRLAPVVLAAAVLLGACSPTDSTDVVEGRDALADLVPDATPVSGAIAAEIDLEGVDLVVGSPSPEEGDATPTILAALTRRSLAEAGADVDDRSEMGAGFLVRDALLSGEIDLSWGGTGEAWTAILRESADGLTGDEIHDRLATRDLDENGVAWLQPAELEDGPRFALAGATAESDDLDTMTSMAERLATDDDAIVCVPATFTTYPLDGQVAVEEALDMTFDPDRLRVYAAEPIYPDTGDGTCLFGVVEATSGRITQNDLVVLTDDVAAFLPNRPAPAVREDVLVDHPDVARVLATVAARLSAAELQEMNRKVVLEGEPVDAVATAWLTDEGLLA
jgi:osmoprotectant transport system substrate-binding protein